MTTMTVMTATSTGHAADPARSAELPTLPAHITAAIQDHWMAELAEVPNTIAYRAAIQAGALITPRGTSGETGHGWYWERAHETWVHDDGYNTVAVDELGDTPGGEPVTSFEVTGWRDNEYRAVELAARFDRMAEREYEKSARRADKRGQAGAFRAAVDALVAADPYALDAGLYARLTGRDPAETTPGTAGVAEDDEDARYPHTR